jgi:transcriptional regulator with XRE-family HTH domain
MRQLARGSDNGNAKLTPEQALDVHLLARSKRYWQRELAEAFGISQSEVSLIEHRRRWRWLLPDNNEGHQMTGKTKDEEFEERLAASEKRVAELEAKLRGEPPRRQTPEPHKPYDPTANFGIATFRCPSNGRRCHRQIDGRLAQRRTQTQPRNRHVSGATHERRERPCANPTGFRLG